MHAFHRSQGEGEDVTITRTARTGILFAEVGYEYLGSLGSHITGSGFWGFVHQPQSHPKGTVETSSTCWRCSARTWSFFPVST